MIKKFSFILSSKKDGESLLVDSDVFEEERVEDLIVKGGMEFTEAAKTARLSILTLTIDTRALYHHMMENEERRVMMIARSQDSGYYHAAGINEVINLLQRCGVDQFTFRHTKVIKAHECYSFDGTGFEEVYEEPFFKDLESISRATTRSFNVLTTDGEEYSGYHIFFLPTRFFKSVDNESIDLFNKLVKMVNSIRGYGNVHSVYFTRPIELAFEYYKYYDAILEHEETVETKKAYSAFDSICIADDGVYLRDDSRTFGQPFLLYIPFDLFKKVHEPSERYYDGFEEAEYIDYRDDDGSDEYDDGSHCTY